MKVQAFVGPLIRPGVLVEAAVKVNWRSPLVKQFDTDFTFSTLVLKPVWNVTSTLVVPCPLTIVAFGGEIGRASCRERV